MIPTLEGVKSKYPNIMSTKTNETLIKNWENDERDYDEPYPHCNYCIGGAIQMAFGQIEIGDVDTSVYEDGIFPSITDLAETLHYYCGIPYALGQEDYCMFPQHEIQTCVTKDDSVDTAYELASDIIHSNDMEYFDDAWTLRTIPIFLLAYLLTRVS